VPAPGTPTSFDGRVSELSGLCPDISFSAGGRHVEASGSTTYKHGDCNHLDNSDKVHVDGLEFSDGHVEATKIEIKR
jgi:hypothetical protein